MTEVHTYQNTYLAISRENHAMCLPANKPDMRYIPEKSNKKCSLHR